ncbi:lysophospholipid acyltransferase family protein [Fodinibius sediminis]|uniref:1-acyl-sn-glycerol-3-phosphate acyltransferase n=1 Tax=Fodinibius sediminis TaxID=1214077 RepID=A0A521E608_9BACT|nr:lysophospholipid acyltransferase family protein [Fodinibius sediminis]SMO79302.1 1-acyl-sn-glycerol-3-phosphate acyltransferase [Fodinibius sediminis]
MKTLFSIFLWIYWAVCIIVFFGVVLVLYLLTFPFDRFHRIPNKVLKGLGRVMLKVNPGWSIAMRGAEQEKIARPTIVVANHQSFLDMPLLYLLPWSMKWVAKKSLFRIPILGWVIYMTGQLGIDRRNMRSAQKLDALVAPVKAGIPAMIFPEGTRSRTGELQRFKNGAFRLAKEYDFNILPVVLQGGNQAMPRGSWRVAPKQHFDIAVLDPIDPGQFGSVNELKEEAFSLIQKELYA